MDFEKKLNRLEEIVVKMERGDLSLDESLKMFEEGIRLSRDCHEQLDQAEQKVQVLLEIDERGEAKTRDFAPDGEE
jgi:exodeoxyribonuclease VII small subunit